MSAGPGFVQLMAPVGPVAEAFVADQTILCGIMGPYGSAKTTSCIRKIITSPAYQNPSPIDGVRRVRWCVVRDTYAQLETNVLNSWFTWFPKTLGDFNGNDMRHTITFQVAQLDGSPAETWQVEVYFRAMGDRKAEEVLKGLELTGLWLNETDTLDRGVLSFGIGRTGRYPSAANGGCQYRAVIADFNAPDVDNWTYEVFVEGKLPISDEQLKELKERLGPRVGVSFHRQPGGRSQNPTPENIKNLPDGYYEMTMLGLSENHIRRFIDNEFGAVRNGQPVFPEYNDRFHCIPEGIKPLKGVPVGIGFDGGSTPAALFGQRCPDTGQVRVLRELVVFSDSADQELERLGPETFGEMMAEVWLEHFANCEFDTAWCDPAALYGDEYADSWARLCWKAFCKRIGAKARQWKMKAAPVKGNRLPERIEGVRRLLTHSPAGRPGYVIAGDACRYLRRGFNNGYVIQRVQMSSGQGRWKDEPVKNDFSHCHDGNQYLVAGLTRRGAEADVVRGDVREDRSEKRAGRSKVNFGSSPFAPPQRSNR